MIKIIVLITLASLAQGCSLLRPEPVVDQPVIWNDWELSNPG